MDNNPIRDMIQAMERISSKPDDQRIMICSLWELLTDIVDGSETEIEGLNTHTEADFRTVLEEVKEDPEMKDSYGYDPNVDPAVELRWLYHLADMIDILYDLHGGRCDIDPDNLTIDSEHTDIDELDDYEYSITVIPDPDTYTVGEHGSIINTYVTHTFHVEDNHVTLKGSI